jgi:hypothetical protein
MAYLYIYDLGGEVDPSRIRDLVRATPTERWRSLLAPEFVKISPSPLSMDLGNYGASVRGSSVRVSLEARIYSIGAISIIARVPIRCSFEELVDYSSPKGLQVEYGDRPHALGEFAREHFERVSQTIKPYITATYPREEEPEEYTVFCIKSIGADFKSELFIRENRAAIAGLLREMDPQKVSAGAAEEATRFFLSYYFDDLVVVDWDASFIVDPSGDFMDYVQTMELANMQLLVLRVYDEHLTRLIDKAYDDVRYFSRASPLSILAGRRLGKVVAELAETRIEMSELYESTMNITKFFGDWALARLYSLLRERMHLREWTDSVSEKLHVLEDLYQMAYDKSNAARLEMLEIVIVLLILFEVIFALIRSV